MFCLFTHTLPTVFHYWNWYLLLTPKYFALSSSFCPLWVTERWNGYHLVTPNFFSFFTHILPTVRQYWNWYLLVLPRFDFLATCFRDCCFAVADIKTSHHWKPILVESYVLFGHKMWREIVEKGKRKGLKYLRKGKEELRKRREGGEWRERIESGERDKEMRKRRWEWENVKKKT